LPIASPLDHLGESNVGSSLGMAGYESQSQLLRPYAGDMGVRAALETVMSNEKMSPNLIAYLYTIQFLRTHFNS